MRLALCASRCCPWALRPAPPRCPIPASGSRITRAIAAAATRSRAPGPGTVGRRALRPGSTRRGRRPRSTRAEQRRRAHRCAAASRRHPAAAGRAYGAVIGGDPMRDRPRGDAPAGDRRDDRRDGAASNRRHLGRAGFRRGRRRARPSKATRQRIAREPGAVSGGRSPPPCRERTGDTGPNIVRICAGHHATGVGEHDLYAARRCG